MRAGRLKRRLELYSKVTSTQNAYGEVVPTISLEDTVWGSIEPLKGVEFFSQQQLQDEVEARIVLRYNASLALDTSWVIKHDGLYYDIVSIDTNRRLRSWTLMCRQGASDDWYTVSSVPANALYDVDGNALQFVDETYWETMD